MKIQEMHGPALTAVDKTMVDSVSFSDIFNKDGQLLYTINIEELSFTGLYGYN